MGYQYIGRGPNIVGAINDYYSKFLNIYVNYHRPSLFVTKKIYGQATTPYEKLKEVSGKKKTNFLKPRTVFAKLDKIAYEKSDNEFARILKRERKETL